MKKVIEFLELSRALCYLTTKCEITRLVAKDVEKVEKLVKDIDDAIVELKSPRWYTPEQWEKRTGEAWPDDWAVYALYENIDGETKWFYGGHDREKKQAIKHKRSLDNIVIATEAGPPPDDWRPEETGNTERKLDFKEPPRIANRSDAIDLLDQLLDAEKVRGMDFALAALRDAVEREVI